MLEIQYRRWYTQHGGVLIAEDISCLESAKVLRKVSGDLVVNSTTGLIVTDQSWLWDWEKEDADCYARKAIQWQLRYEPTFGSPQKLIRTMKDELTVYA